jgi:hypothetical protein
MNDVVTFLRNYDYDICLAKGDSWALEEAVDYLAAYLTNKQIWTRKEEAYNGFLSIKDQLLAVVQHGIDEGKLVVDEEFYQDVASEGVIMNDGLNFKKSTVIIASFIEWAIESSIEIPAAYAKYAADHKGSKARYYEKLGVKKSTIHHERSRAIAEMLWSSDPEIPIAEMARRPEIIEFGCEGQIYDMRTISRWLANLKADRRPGRRNKEKFASGLIPVAKP